MNAHSRIIFLILLARTTLCVASVLDPALVVVIMVKNEEEVIVKTLQPFFDSGVNHFVVLDTGSTDKTVEVTQDFFDKNSNIIGYVFKEEFVDFATSRNKALELTREKFPNGGFIIMPDAEWYIVNAHLLLEFCQKEASINTHVSAYLIRLLFGSIDFYQPRLIRIQSPAVFKEEIHETMYADGITPENIYFLVQPSEQGYEKSKKRWERDKEVLLKKNRENPNDPRTLFYLAQTYDCLQDFGNAYKYYKLRTQVEGWQEENFMAHYRLAQVLENHMNDWQSAFENYLKAFCICPTRAEPLVKIAQYYWKIGNTPVSYLFAQYAGQMDYPINDRLFIDKEIYDFTRHEMIGITAWHMGKYDIGREAAKKAHEQRPNLDYLKHNVECYG